MGCFLGCFGSSKEERKRTKNAQIDSHRTRDIQNQYNNVCNTPTLLAKQETLKKPINLRIPESCIKLEEKDELELTIKAKPQEKLNSVTQKKVTFFDSNAKEHELQEQVSSGARKKVTFDSNVKEYDHVPYHEPPEIVEESEKDGEKGVDENCIKPIKSSSESEAGSTLSSLGSFPPNHRYQNCRESDDEEEELDCEVSDLDEDEDEDEEGVFDDDYSDDEYHLRQVEDLPNRSCSSGESRTKTFSTSLVDHGSLEREARTTLMLNHGARNRAGYVDSVLNPVENTAQWKSVKVKGTPPIKKQKENFIVDLGFQQSSSKPKQNLDEPKNSHDVAVNASLSTWLVSSQKTPTNHHLSSAASVSSHGSNSVRSHEGRPILGALTVEEERKQQFSATSSPRRSSSQTPDERHSNDRTPVENPGSVSSFKGIPNTTSKYREVYTLSEIGSLLPSLDKFFRVTDNRFRDIAGQEGELAFYTVRNEAGEGIKQRGCYSPGVLKERAFC